MTTCSCHKKEPLLFGQRSFLKFKHNGVCFEKFSLRIGLYSREIQREGS